MSLALYRRYRPETFAEVIGQEHVTDPLQQALRNNRVNHAYLFSGPRGCGKTTSARILARCLNCEQGPTPTPCGECRSCLDLARNGPGSIDVIEIDAASHGGVDDARDLREKAFFGPAGSRYKIYIIDEAHMVTSAGFNALLKVVEEPPEHLKFIFATTEPEKVIGTIRSRTHHYPFRLVPPGTLRDYLAEVCDREAIPVQDGVYPLVVRAGAGSVRDSMSVMDQLLAGAAEDGVTYAMATALLGYTDAALLDDVVDGFAAGDGAAVFGIVERVIEGGHDPRRFVADLLERLRDLVILAAVPDAVDTGLIDAPREVVERMRAQSAVFGAAELSRAADLVNTGLTEMRGATSPRLQLELICARVLLPAAYDDERSVQARLERLERGVGTGAGMMTGGGFAAAGAVGPGAPAGPVGPVENALAGALQTGPQQHGGGQPGQPVPPGGGAAAARAAMGGGAGNRTAGEPQGQQPAARQPQATPPPAQQTPVQPPQAQQPQAQQSTPPQAPQPQAADAAAPVQATPPAAPAPAPAAPRPGAWPTTAGAPASPPARAPQQQPQPQAAPPPSQPAATPAPAPTPASASAGPGGDPTRVRQAWPQILDAVKNRRRLTWMLLFNNAQVSGFDGETLQIGFDNLGARNSFTNSGSEDVLKQAVHDALGVQWRIEAIVDPSGGQGGQAGGPHQPPQGPRPPGPQGQGGGGSYGGGSYGGGPSAYGNGPGGQGPGAGPGGQGQGQGPGPGAGQGPGGPGHPQGGPQGGPPPDTQGALRTAAAPPAPRSAPAPAARPDFTHSVPPDDDDPPPPPIEDDIPEDDDPDLEVSAVQTGHDLFIKELGATVIEDIKHV
ncbi:DNA polymerase III subunit gamma and tau [Streptomyces sp. CA-111067]|uniref:DNA polymerase III subunit gamma and tau n=1 Tax=Streptomyces sp. CA-111067 TaxID=3240046 RepID=UPI003D950CB7